MAKKIDTIKLGDYSTKDEVKVDIRIDTGTGQFEACFNNQEYKNESLKALKATLVDEHRVLHDQMDWIRAIYVSIKKREITEVYAARIGDVVFMNAEPERDGNEKRFATLSWQEREIPFALPMTREASWEGNVYLLPHTPENLKALHEATEAMDVVSKQWNAAFQVFKLAVAKLGGAVEEDDEEVK